MSRTALNIILSVIAVILVFLIAKSVMDPIKKQAEINRVEALVKNKLDEIKRAQFTYRDMNDTFASNFNDLINGLKNGKVAVLKKLGGKAADTLSNIQVDTAYIDAMEFTFEGEYDINNIGKVPPSNKNEFILKAKVIESQGIDLPVFIVKDPNPINPKDTLMLGSLQDAIFTGNWK